jgi:uncharacterized protein YkwD
MILPGRQSIDTEVLMARSKFARSLRFDSLEGRQLLSTAGPTDQEQYMLQLVNEARTAPAAAAQMLTTNLTPDVQATLQYYGVNVQATAQTIASSKPLPPVAWNADLASSAQTQSQYMADNQIQTHTGANGSNSQQRMQQAGYTNISSSGENAFAYSTSPEEAMQAFLFDWGVPSDGHRITIQQPGVSPQNAYRDVGIAIVQTNPSNPNFGPMVITQDFGSQTNEQAQVVGVAYYDNAGTGFYQPDEGQGGVQVDAVNSQTGQVASTQTWASGGYELSLAPGQYTIIASLNGEVIQSSKLKVGTVNVEQDYILTNTWQGGTRESAIAAAQPQAAPVVAVSQPGTTRSNFAAGVIPALTTTQPTSSTSALSSWSLWSVNVR